MIKGIIFDMDGPLLDSLPIWETAGARYLKTLGIQARPDLSAALAELDMAGGARYLKAEYELKLEVSDIIAGINQTIRDFYHNEAMLKEGVLDFLTGLKNAGIKLTLATSCDREVFEPALERLRIKSLFDGIFTCSELSTNKNEPDIFLKAAEAMNTSPEETWVFEDSLFALRTAGAAGFRTVGVSDPSNQSQTVEIKKVSDLYFERLNHYNDFLNRANS